jgi:nitroimidazol reductase NimA-like FMN-containing flavoprotein (pyridoxamine 5'-phosphate oxidase superfamily)
MTTHENPQRSAYRFRELTTAECIMLLQSKRVGRIVWCGSNGPQALPVNYVVDAGRVLFRTSPHSTIAKVAVEQQVAFEVDDIDEFVETGWSVLVVGTARGVDDPGDIPRSLQDRPEPWAPGTRNLYIRIQPETVTGRRVVSD